MYITLNKMLDKFNESEKVLIVKNYNKPKFFGTVKEARDFDKTAKVKDGYRIDKINKVYLIDLA